MAEEYTHILKNVCALFKALGITEVKDIFASYCYLQWKGYLSFDGAFCYSNFSCSIDRELRGVGVRAGRAVCEQQASFLSCLLTMLGIRNYRLAVYSNFAKLSYRTGIERQVEKTSFSLSKVLKKPLVDMMALPNHRVVMVDDLCLDPTNLCIAQHQLRNRFALIDGEGTFLAAGDCSQVSHGTKITDLGKLFQNNIAYLETNVFSLEQFTKENQPSMNRIATLLPSKVLYRKRN